MAFWSRKKSPLEEALAARAHWYPTENPESPLRARVRCEEWRIAVKRTPVGPRVSLAVEGKDLGEVATWPPEWPAPGDEMGPLQTVLAIVRGHAPLSSGGSRALTEVLGASGDGLKRDP